MRARSGMQNISAAATDENRLEQRTQRHARGNLLAFMELLISLLFQPSIMDEVIFIWIGQTLSFGRYNGRSLPEIVLTDPDWFFLAISKGVFQGKLMTVRHCRRQRFHFSAYRSGVYYRSALASIVLV